MVNEGANIWFARNKDGNIVTIDKINQDNRHDDYKCPICGSNIIPKAIKEDAQMTRHFAHRDASKCDRETQIHFFVKNELLKQGDKFTIRFDNNIKEFICKEILIEQKYKTEFGVYNPDITVITEDNKIIYFEVSHTNKKKIEDYLDMWMELNNIVVEIESRDMINGKFLREFNAKFYEGKCFNIKQEDKEYYELIGKIKLNKNKYPIEQVNKLDWLWRDINKYLSGEIEISIISDEIQSIEDKEFKDIVVSILRRNRCKNIMNDYIEYNINNVENFMNNQGFEYCVECKKTRIVYERIFRGCDGYFYYKDIFLNKLFINYNDTLEKYNEIYKYEIMCMDFQIYLIEKLKDNNDTDCFLNYYFSDYDNEHRLILNNFTNQTYYNGYGNECNKFIVIGNKTREKISKELDVYIDAQLVINKTKRENDEKINNLIKKITVHFKCIDRIIISGSYFKIFYKDVSEYESIYIYKNSKLNEDIDYYKKEIQKHILRKVYNELIKRINKYFGKTKIEQAVNWNYDNIRLLTDNGSILIPIINFKFDINSYSEDILFSNTLKYIVNIEHRISKYLNYFIKFKIMCSKSKNNYSISLLNNKITIRYKTSEIKTFDFLQIKNIYDILNDEYFKKSIIDDLEDYNKYSLINIVVNKINDRYYIVKRNWSIRRWDENIIYIYDGLDFKFQIDIPKGIVEELDLFNNLIDKISKNIRTYLYR